MIGQTNFLRRRLSKQPLRWICPVTMATVLPKVHDHNGLVTTPGGGGGGVGNYHICRYAGTGCAIFWGAFFRAENKFWGIIFGKITSSNKFWGVILEK